MLRKLLFLAGVLALLALPLALALPQSCGSGQCSGNTYCVIDVSPSLCTAFCGPDVTCGAAAPQIETPVAQGHINSTTVVSGASPVAVSAITLNADSWLRASVTGVVESVSRVNGKVLIQQMNGSTGLVTYSFFTSRNLSMLSGRLLSAGTPIAKIQIAHGPELLYGQGNAPPVTQPVAAESFSPPISESLVSHSLFIDVGTPRVSQYAAMIQGPAAVKTVGSGKIAGVTITPLSSDAEVQIEQTAGYIRFYYTFIISKVDVNAVESLNGKTLSRGTNLAVALPEALSQQGLPNGENFLLQALTSQPSLPSMGWLPIVP